MVKKAATPALLMAALALCALCLALWWMNELALAPAGWFWNCGCSIAGASGGLQCSCRPIFPVGWLLSVVAPLMCIIGLPTIIADLVFSKALGFVRKTRWK